LTLELDDANVEEVELVLAERRKAVPIASDASLV
jgi:hypothetical protein